RRSTDMTARKTRKYPCLVQKLFDLTCRRRLRDAVDILPLLSRNGIRLKSRVIASLIRQCADEKSVDSGNLVGLHLKLTGRKRCDLFLSNHLIFMYAKCGDLVKAREVFDKMPVRNLYSWNNMLSGYCNSGMIKAAVRLFDRMPGRNFLSWNAMVTAYVRCGWFDEAVKLYMELRKLDIGFNEYSFAGVLSVCVKLKELWLTKQLHCQVLVVGFLSNMILSSSVTDAYSKCGEMGDARRLFDDMKKRDTVAWTILISGYSQAADMTSAQEIFDAMPKRNTFSWNALIGGYSRNGKGDHSLELFSQMMMLGFESDEFTYSSCFLACGTTAFLEIGRQLHTRAITSGIRPNVAVVSSLIRMYSSCRRFDIAKRVLTNGNRHRQHHVLPWNTMMAALSDHHGNGKRLALRIFFEMLSLGVEPEADTFIVLFDACRGSSVLVEGIRLFES
ncbi:hypothetical protein M569_00469, partial [Genlisea aurea]